MVVVAALLIVVLSGCAYTPAGRERRHVEGTLRGLKELRNVSIGCGGGILASDSVCADIVSADGKSLRFDRLGFNSFGANATNVVVAEADGWVPRVSTCNGVEPPNFHRQAPLGHHFQPTLIDVKEAITRAREVLEEIQFWPECPQSWEVQDKRGVNYRYCVRRKDAADDPPRPTDCDQRDR
jgi:hypothetical protein